MCSMRLKVLLGRYGTFMSSSCSLFTLQNAFFFTLITIQNTPHFLLFYTTKRLIDLISEGISIVLDEAWQLVAWARSWEITTLTRNMKQREQTVSVERLYNLKANASLMFFSLIVPNCSITCLSSITKRGLRVK